MTSFKEDMAKQADKVFKVSMKNQLSSIEVVTVKKALEFLEAHK